MTRRPLTKTDAVLFDLDGTLWDSVAGVSAAWQRALQSDNPPPRGPITDEEVRACMGQPVDVIAQRLFPMLDEKRRAVLMEKCFDAEHRHLREVGGAIYPGVEETLGYLEEKYPLAIISNCEVGYIENFLAISGFGRYFRDFESFGRTGLHKSENVKLVVARNKFQHACFVGDTILDQISAADSGLPFIYARYGFGKLSEFDYAIDSFGELRHLL